MDAFKFAVERYLALVARDDRGAPILNDAVRTAVAEELHVVHPGWFESFNLDAVERTVWNDKK